MLSIFSCSFFSDWFLMYLLTRAASSKLDSSSSYQFSSCFLILSRNIDFSLSMDLQIMDLINSLGWSIFYFYLSLNSFKNRALLIWQHFLFIDWILFLDEMSAFLWIWLDCALWEGYYQSSLGLLFKLMLVYSQRMALLLSFLGRITIDYSVSWFSW